MNLYHLTAIPGTSISGIAQGSFTAPRQHELVVSTGTALEIFRLHARQGRLQALFRHDMFAKIRAISAFRLYSTRRDYLVVTSDSGCLAVLSADATSGVFRQVHCEAFDRSGCRRVVPGEWLACEPRGRACMTGAVERAKFVYVLNRDAQDRLTLSSPLEAHKSAHATLALQALDVGFDNPVFAALERAYSPYQKAPTLLVYYELDLGLNTVVRKLTSPVDQSSSLLVPVPGHTDGPGGVLVCSGGFVTYRNLLEDEEYGDQQLNVDANDQDVDMDASTEPTGNDDKKAATNKDGMNKDQQPQANGNSKTHPDPGKNNSSKPSRPRIEVPLPFRRGTNIHDTHVVCATAYHDRKGNAFFFLLCTEHGDLIKAELSWTPEEGATQLRLVYFDTLPTAAVAMTIFRSGFLFVALEGCDALLLKFRAVDVANDDPVGGVCYSESFSSAKDPNLEAHAGKVYVHSKKNGGIDLQVTLSSGASRDCAGQPFYNYQVRLRHLSVEATLESLGPILGITDGTDVHGSSFLINCGRGRAASLRALRRGVGVMEMSSAHTLASRITNVFTFSQSNQIPYHKFIIVSFRDRTKVLQVGDTRVEEITSTGFHLGVPTLCAGLLGLASPVQVHPQGVRFIPAGRAADAAEWNPPHPARIIAACCNSSQLVIALSSSAVVYFEVDPGNDSLVEIDRVSNALSDNNNAQGHGTSSSYDDDAAHLNSSGGSHRHHHHHSGSSSSPALAIPQVPPNRTRASFFAVADALHSKVRVYRITSDGSPQSLGIHIAPAPIESIAFVDFGISENTNNSGDGGQNLSANKTSNSDSKTPGEEGQQYQPLLNLIIGTKHGAIVRVSVDGDTGSLGDKRTLFIGPDRVRCYAANMGGVTTCFALGSYPHLLYAQGGRIETSPISGGDTFAHVAPLCSDEFPGGFVAAHGSRMRLLCIDLLHALQAGCHSSLRRGAPSALAAQTRIASLFHLSRSRMQATVRRVARVSETVSSQQPSSSNSNKSKRPRTQSLFVVAESEHRVKCRPSQIHLRDDHGPITKQPYFENAPPGSWFSRLSLVRLRGPDGGDVGASARVGSGSNVGGNDMDGRDAVKKDDARHEYNDNNRHTSTGADDDDNGEEEMDFDDTDPLVNLNMDAVTKLDRVLIEDTNDCIVAVTSTCSFGIPTDGSIPTDDTISYVVVSRACNSVVSATSATARHDRAVHYQQLTPKLQKETSETNDPESLKKILKKKPNDQCFGILSVYRVTTYFKLVHMHDTRISEPAYVVTPFRDMVAIGVGQAVRLYALGRRQLLRKVEYRAAVRNRVCAISSAGGDRLFVADRQESVTLFKYTCRRRPNRSGAGNESHNGLAPHHPSERQLELNEGGLLQAIASDELSRWVTCLHTLDYSTVCGGDLFGNIFILRLPPEISPGAEHIQMTSNSTSDPLLSASSASGVVSGAARAPHRLRVEASMHVGSAVSVVTSGRLDCSHFAHVHSAWTNDDLLKQADEETGLIYATMTGAVGVIKPLTTRSDADFAKRLEMSMRKGWRSPVGRDHLAFRSSFYACRGIVDGDLCELFVAASTKERKQWAADVARSEHDIDRKLDELRAAIV